MVLGLSTIAFYFAMNAANIYVILKDGMAQRAMAVMMKTDRAELNKYFAANYLARDPVLAVIDNGNPMTAIRLRALTTGSAWSGCGPGPGRTPRGQPSPRIPGIDGRILASWRGVTPPDQLNPPSWQAGRYDVVMVREGGQWHIRSMKYMGAYP